MISNLKSRLTIQWLLKLQTIFIILSKDLSISNGSITPLVFDQCNTGAIHVCR
jgi:hypothetical protein